jgi:hypothetical protein
MKTTIYGFPEEKLVILRKIAENRKKVLELSKEYRELVKELKDEKKSLGV